MSTTVSFLGGLPVGFGIFGFFLVLVPTASASFVTLAVGFANVGGLAAVVVVVSTLAELLPVSLPLGIAAVLVPPPQAARPTHANASAGNFDLFRSPVTAGTLAAVS